MFSKIRHICLPSASIKIGADAYAKVYGNGTFSTDGATLVNTVFNINGNKYMTVYAQAGDVAIDTVLSEESFVNGTTAVPSASDSVNWNQKEDYLEEMVADNKNIGESGYETVNYQTSTVKVTFTLAADTTLSLDSKSITNGNVLTLVVGHSYTITTNGTVNGTGVSGTTYTPTTSSTTVSVTAAQS